MYIIERFTRKSGNVSGGLIEALEACVERNRKFKEAGIQGSYSLQDSFPWSPDEYPKILEVIALRDAERAASD